jgi:hypothetical protein
MRGQNRFDLPQVIDVVACHHSRDVLDGLLAAFGMNAEMLPLLRRKRFQQGQVRLAGDTKLLEAFAGVAFGVVTCGYPAS